MVSAAAQGIPSWQHPNGQGELDEVDRRGIDHQRRDSADLALGLEQPEWVAGHNP